MNIWIARDYRGLYLFEEKPHDVIGRFVSYKGFITKINEDLFPDVTFENSPQQVEIKLITEE